MNVIVLGGSGMLGHKMFQVLGKRFNTTCILRTASDIPLFASNTITGVDALDCRGLLEELRPDVIVNCVGIIKQRDAAKSAVPSISINALLPHELAEWASSWGGRVIHFSTDCVFSGKRGSYREDDVSDAEDLYGRSKFLGEVATDNALTIRTSIIGRELAHYASLLEWFFAQRGQKIRGFARVIYSGLTTAHLSEIVGDVIAAHPSLHGVYQVASEPITKYELLCKVREAFAFEVDIEKDEEAVLDRSMIGDRFETSTGIKVRSWNEMITQLAADKTPYAEWQRK